MNCLGISTNGLELECYRNGDAENYVKNNFAPPWALRWAELCKSLTSWLHVMTGKCYGSMSHYAIYCLQTTEPSEPSTLQTVAIQDLVLEQIISQALQRRYGSILKLRHAMWSKQDGGERE